MNILITSAGQRVSLVRAFQNELRKEFPDGRVLTVDMRPQLSAACNASDGYFKVKRVTDPSYIPELLELCMRQKIGMIVPTIDTELIVLSDNKQFFSRHGISVIISAAEFVRKCRDKRLTSDFFTENNIGVPQPIDKRHPVFPLFIKPYDGSLSADTFLIRNSEELTSYHLDNEKFLFMEYIDRNDYDEFTVDMYYGKDHFVKCIVPRKRIHIRSGEINKGLTCKNAVVSFLKQRLNHIEGAVGCLTTQLFLAKRSDRIVAIEINPRFGGGFPLSYAAGANYPGWLIKEYFRGDQIGYTDTWEDRLLMLRYDDEVLVHDYKA